MTDELHLEVPENYLSLLKGHIPNQSDDFLIGFCSLLSFQYSQSKFSRFYENYSHGDFSIYLTELLKYLNSGTSAPLSSGPVKDEGTNSISVS